MGGSPSLPASTSNSHTLARPAGELLPQWPQDRQRSAARVHPMRPAIGAGKPNQNSRSGSFDSLIEHGPPDTTTFSPACQLPEKNVSGRENNGHVRTISGTGKWQPFMVPWLRDETHRTDDADTRCSDRSAKTKRCNPSDRQKRNATVGTKSEPKPDEKAGRVTIYKRIEFLMTVEDSR